jgi:lipoyl(octanoyl) transferase
MNSIIIRKLGLCDYLDVWEKMRALTMARTKDTQDEIWLLQHHPVFTQGLAGKPEHILNPGDIPVIQTDRGGQVTYHGPGQLIAYPLFDLRRLQFGVRKFVSLLENSVIALLADYKINAQNREDAPGVYVGAKKICSIGLKIRHGCCYHGIALNVDMDLSPFLRINPCGYKQLAMAQISDFVEKIDWEEIENKLGEKLSAARSVIPAKAGIYLP